MKTGKANNHRTPPVVILAEAATLDLSEIGTKAANLARLTSAGFPVPPGIVVTPAARANWDEVCPQLRESAAELGAQRFAVRSSGTAEDLEGASFAGQYETLLDVPLDDLPEAMTPLFADWLLRLVEDGYLREMRATVGTAVPFGYAAIHGWYYTSLPEVSPWILARALIQSRGRMIGVLWNVLVRVNNDPVAADRAVLRRLGEEWRTEILPRYRRLVTTAQERVESATPAQLAGIVDEVGTTAGEYLFSLAMVGGSAWKMEGCLARFVHQHLADEVDFSYQLLLRGLPGVDAGIPPHAVQSVDWYHPTLGELGVGGRGSDPSRRRWRRCPPAGDRKRAGSRRRGVPCHAC